MRGNPHPAAALVAAVRGWRVFPVEPAGKTPAISGWQKRATSDTQQIYRWWHNDAAMNIGIATGQSGLAVVDLDQGQGEMPPTRFAGARDGRDASAMLAAAARADLPTDTYTVSTPGGCHLYFRAPAGVGLRRTAGTVGWANRHPCSRWLRGWRRFDPPGRVLPGGARQSCVAELPGWAGSRRYRHNGKHDSLLAAVRHAIEHGREVQPSPAQQRRITVFTGNISTSAGGRGWRAGECGGVSG